MSLWRHSALDKMTPILTACFPFMFISFFLNCWCVVVVFIGYKKIILMLVTVSWEGVGGGGSSVLT